MMSKFKIKYKYSFHLFKISNLKKNNNNIIGEKELDKIKAIAVKIYNI